MFAFAQATFNSSVSGTQSVTTGQGPAITVTSVGSNTATVTGNGTGSVTVSFPALSGIEESGDYTGIGGDEIEVQIPSAASFGQGLGAPFVSYSIAATNPSGALVAGPDGLNACLEDSPTLNIANGSKVFDGTLESALSASTVQTSPALTLLNLPDNSTTPTTAVWVELDLYAGSVATACNSSETTPSLASSDAGMTTAVSFTLTWS